MRNRILIGTMTFLVILFVLIGLGVSMGLHSFTIIEWWKPVILCGALSLPLTLWISRFIVHLTRPIFKFLEYPVSFIFSFSILLATFYISNFFLSDHSSVYEYHAPVVKKYQAERTRSKRIGRRTYGQEKYKVYFIEIEMKDGKLKKLEKSYQEYNRIKKGSTLRLFIEDGLFKIPVIKPQHKN